MRIHRDLKVYTLNKNPVPKYRKRIKESKTRAELVSLRGSVENNLNVSNRDMGELIMEIGKKKLEVCS